jgi:exopolysaccharide biosynthesis polyprenyl glycosylphosphotransferase
MKRNWRDWVLSRWAQVSVDLLLLNIACVLAWYIRYQLRWFRDVETGYYNSLDQYITLFAGLNLALILAFTIQRVYEIQRGTAFVEEMFRVSNGILLSIMLLVLVTFGLRPLAFSRLLFFYAGALCWLLFGAARLLRRTLEAEWRRQGYNVSNVLVVGVGEKGRGLLRAIVAHPELGYRVVGYLDDDPQLSFAKIGRFQGFGTLADLETVLQQRSVQQVFVTLPWQAQPHIVRIVELCQKYRVHPRVMPDFFQLNLKQVDVETLSGLPLIGIRESRLTESGQWLKRGFDLLALLLAAPLLIPLCSVIAVLIKLDSPGPIFFLQERIGFYGQRFKIVKFRTMCQNAEAMLPELLRQNEATGPLFKIKSDPRITRVGWLLRRTSLDELPQLINVLRGEMSLIGPRPALPARGGRVSELAAATATRQARFEWLMAGFWSERYQFR